MPSLKNHPVIRFILFFILGILVLLPALAIGFDALGYKAYLPQQWQDWLAIEWESNSISRWIQAATLVIGTAAGLVGLKIWLRARLATSEVGTQRFRKFGLHIARRTNSLFLILLALSAGMSLLRLPDDITITMGTVMAVTWALQIALWANELVADAVIALAQRGNGAENGSIKNAIELIRMAVRGLVWAITAISILDTLGYDITTLVAGLGIGGAAIALASQGVLADFLSTLGIVMDKPFVVGDNITVGETTGTVEVIGMKTTRIRSISGEQIVVPNGDLLKGRIRNFKRMQERRVASVMVIVYETPAAKVAAIPDMIKAIVEDQPKARFDRVHVANFATNGIEIELVYAVLTNDYREHMYVRQAVNLGILAAFEKAAIDFWRPAPPPSVLARQAH